MSVKPKEVIFVPRSEAVRPHLEPRVFLRLVAEIVENEGGRDPVGSAANCRKYLLLELGWI